CADYGMNEKKLAPDAIEALKKLPWTGNIRELRNMIERLIILSDKVITQNDVIIYANPSSAQTHNNPNSNHNHTISNNGQSEIDYDQYASFQDYKDQTEKNYIKYKLEKNAWNVSKTADDIEIQRSHLYSKIEKYGLKRDS